MTFAEKLDALHQIRPCDVLALLDEPKVRRIDIARAYALMLSEHWLTLAALDVRALNLAIEAHWSLSGLCWIKKEAWAIAQGKR